MRDDGLRQRYRTTHAHGAARFGDYFIDDVLRGLCFFQYGTTVCVETLADIGDRETSRGPLQQAHAEAFLELCDPFAEPRLGHAERAPCGRKAALFDHSREELEVIEVVQRTLGHCHHRSPW